ncbi:MAG: hypothetical protein KGN36_02055, partial [Acidobacteriota bacterium]|nr:hypothetical protein [Acidobacteriota bacterium]
MHFILGLLLGLAPVARAAVPVAGDSGATARERTGIERLRVALDGIVAPGARVIAATRGSAALAGFAPPEVDAANAEAYHLARRGGTWLVVGSGPSGVLYGCLELARRVQEGGRLPEDLDFADAPVFKLRGPALGMQKTAITYDGGMYDYRYTPEEFPFFYDKALWTRYLDFLMENRFNTLYLWNGHPFTSLLKLPRYPEAQELTDAQLERNMAMFRWLTAEADRRGIWVIQSFYNIHISHALARAHGIGFQLSTPTEFTSAYTRYCIGEFIRTYPNVGIMMTLGEALRPEYGPEWLTGTIIPGVKDGMRELGLTREPPIIVRAHATRIEDAIRQALPLYRNIYTMHKWNGESLTWTDVRGEVLRLHESLVKLGSAHIANIHLLSNLEPYRWGAPTFVQKTLESARRIGIQGVHVYPLRYWDWPNSPDNPAEIQFERDWIWFETWGRYAWNPARDAAAERRYWIGRIAAHYGNEQAAAKILDAYELSGVCAPRLLPRIGITEGNRQSFTLGMLMTQLIDPERYNALTLLWEGDAPPGERLADYVRKEWQHEPHTGETPVGVADEVLASAERAVAAAEAAAPLVTRGRAEFERLRNDMHAMEAQYRYYDAKTRAAALVLRYGYSRDAADLRAALPLLRQSLEDYRGLVAITDKTYREGPSVHSISRRIPFLGGPGRYTHWRDCLPAYEKELANFERNLKMVESAGARPAEVERAAWTPLAVKLTAGPGESFPVRAGEKLYTDADVTIEHAAPELAGMRGIRIPRQAAGKGVRLEIELAEPGQILIGFFRSEKKNGAASPPKDEWDPLLRNGVTAAGQAAFTVWAHQLPRGKSDLDFGPGAWVVLGAIPQSVQPEARMVFYSAAEAGWR